MKKKNILIVMCVLLILGMFIVIVKMNKEDDKPINTIEEDSKYEPIEETMEEEIILNQETTNDIFNMPSIYEEIEQ